jgi:hypothetical protein
MAFLCNNLFSELPEVLRHPHPVNAPEQRPGGLKLEKHINAEFLKKSALDLITK